MPDRRVECRCGCEGVTIISEPPGGVVAPEEAIQAAARWLFFEFTHDDSGDQQPTDEHYLSAARSLLAAVLPALRRQDDSATCAELRRQLAGVNALLADAERERDTLRAHLRAVLDLCAASRQVLFPSAYGYSPGWNLDPAAVLAAAGVTGDGP